MNISLNNYNLFVDIKDDSLVAKAFGKVAMINSMEDYEILGYVKSMVLEFDPILNAQGCCLPFNSVMLKKITKEPWYIWKPGNYLKLNSKKLIKINSRPELDFFIRSFTIKVNGIDTVDYEKVQQYYDGIVVSKKVQKVLQWQGDILLLNNKSISSHLNINKEIGGI